MMRRKFKTILGLALAVHLLAPVVQAYEFFRSPRLHEDRHRSGSMVLNAFSGVAEAARGSIVKLELDGAPAAFGAVIDSGGLVITKASEIVGGNLTCRLPDGEEVEASLVLVNEENDLGLVRVNATGLTPIQWASEEVVVGQWAVTPGIETYPETVGIISVPPRKIPPGRALIGVQLESGAVIAGLMEGYGAEKAGLKPGDVVLSVNDQNVGSSPELTRTLRQYRQGEKVKLLVRRGEEEFETEVLMMVHPERRTGDRPVRRFVGEVSRRAAGFDLVLQHDSVLSPWQCGGPLLNLEGKAIGVNIARAGRIASYALPARLVQEIIEDLESRSQLMVDHQEGVETSR